MLSERLKAVPSSSDTDLNVGATQSGASINMSGYHKCTFYVNLQTLGGANPDFGVYSGTTAAAEATFVPFKYALASAAAGAANADVLAAWTDASALVTLSHANDDNKLLVVEVRASAMTAGHKWLVFRTADTATGATGNYSCLALLEPRYTKGQSPTALA